MNTSRDAVNILKPWFLEYQTGNGRPQAPSNVITLVPALLKYCIFISGLLHSNSFYCMRHISVIMKMKWLRLDPSSGLKVNILYRIYLPWEYIVPITYVEVSKMARRFQAGKTSGKTNWQRYSKTILKVSKCDRCVSYATAKPKKKCTLSKFHRDA